MAKYAQNMGTGALSGAAQGAAIGSVIPGIGTVIGGIVGGVAGLLSGGLSTYQNESQTSEMQKMIDDNYDKLMDTIQKEYETEKTGIGQVYSAGSKANKAQTEATLGAQGLSGSPIAAALEREYGNTQAKNAAANYTNLAQNKANAELNATANKGTSNEDLVLANMQSQNQIMENNFSQIGSAGGSLASLLGGNSNIGAALDTEYRNVIPNNGSVSELDSSFFPNENYNNLNYYDNNYKAGKPTMSQNQLDNEAMNNMGRGIE